MKLFTSVVASSLLIASALAVSDSNDFDPTFAPTHAPFTDINIWYDDYEIDFGGESGWKIYEEWDQSDALNPTTPLCPDDECLIETNATTYYGVDGTTDPIQAFSDKNKFMMERHFQCPLGNEHWSMTISWKVGFCGIPSYDKKVHTTLFLEGFALEQTNFYSGRSPHQSTDGTLSSTAPTTLYDPELDSICADGWDTQTITVSNLVLDGGYIPGGEKISAMIRTRLRNAAQNALVYAIHVQCVDLPNDFAPVPTLRANPPASVDSVCVSIPSQGAFSHLHDEYDGDYAIDRQFYNGAFMLEKYDGGVIWWHSHDSHWALGSDAGETIMECSAASSEKNVNNMADGAPFCVVDRVYDSNAIVIVGEDTEMPTITEGECKNDHVVVSGVGVGTGTGVQPMLIGMSDQTRAVFTLIGVALISYMVGMMTCCVCMMLSDWRSSRKYQKVAKEEIVDF